MKFKEFIEKNQIKSIDFSEENLSFLKEVKNKHEVCAFFDSESKKLIDLRDKIENFDERRFKPVFLYEEEAIELIRHDLAHIMADAIQRIYGAKYKVKFAIGPTVENGFYYDFEIEGFKISENELKEIEEMMSLIQKENLKLSKFLVPRNLALEFFKSENDSYKVEIIESIPENESISFYSCESFVDLCRGPHFLKTKFPCAFKLERVCGAYWRGDSKNKMLTRIYGLAFNSKDLLKAYIKKTEEALKRDHRKIGPELGLFHLQEEAQGQVFWHPRGHTVYRIIEDYIRTKLSSFGYVEVKTPLLANRILWEKSGHWSKFKENMFVIESREEKDLTDEESNSVPSKQMAVKPMNCPLHVQIFNQKIHSYRDLPLRMAEFGCCHRHESSGALHGIMRVLSFVQDDAHIFCTEDQIQDEIILFCNLLKTVYKDFGFDDVFVKFSDRPEDPEKRAGDDQIWDKAESSLEKALKASNLPYALNKGEGAFYGPKLEFVLKDAIGRDWQCGTIQVDFVLPERLDASYINSEGKKVRPVMLHRAIIGTFERFIGILIENYAGNFPFWLAPLQIMIVNVTNQVDQYAKNIYEIILKKTYKDKNGFSKNLRIDIDLSNEQLNYKLKKYSGLKIPLIIILGEKEVENKEISLRFFGNQKTMNCKIEDFEKIIEENFGS